MLALAPRSVCVAWAISVPHQASCWGGGVGQHGRGVGSEAGLEAAT